MIGVIRGYRGSGPIKRARREILLLPFWCVTWAQMPALHFTWTTGNGVVFRLPFRGGRPLSHGHWRPWVMDFQ